MKIAYLSTFYPFRGGISQFNSSLYREFANEQQVYPYNFKRQYPDLLFPGKSQYVEKDDKVDKIESEQILDSINPFTYITTAGRIKAYSPDMLIMKFWMPFFAPSLGYVARKLQKSGTVTLSILDNVIPHERRLGDIALTKYFLKGSDGFAVMSETVKNDLLKLKPSAKYKLLNHPLYDHFGEKVDKKEARKALNIDDDKKVLLFFGFIRSYKGLDILLKAVAKLPEDYVVIIAGEVYGSFDEYDKLIAKLELKSQIVKHVRYISDAEVPYFFSAADVCVLPYKSATQSGIVGIAYHFDLPVIATDTGGLKEIVITNNTGILVEKPEPDLVRNAILEYFESNKSAKFIENISEYKKICSWENFASGIIDLYNEIKGKKRI